MISGSCFTYSGLVLHTIILIYFYLLNIAGGSTIPQAEDVKAITHGNSDQIQQQQSFSRIHLEISPQYHSASVSRLLVSVMADGAIFDLTGFAGRTGNRHRHTHKHTKITIKYILY